MKPLPSEAWPQTAEKQSLTEQIEKYAPKQGAENNRY